MRTQGSFLFPFLLWHLRRKVNNIQHCFLVYRELNDVQTNSNIFFFSTETNFSFFKFKIKTSPPYWKKYNDQTYSCLERLSSLCTMPEPWNPSAIRNTIVSRGPNNRTPFFQPKKTGKSCSSLDQKYFSYSCLFIKTIIIFFCCEAKQNSVQFQKQTDNTSVPRSICRETGSCRHHLGCEIMGPVNPFRFFIAPILWKWGVRGHLESNPSSRMEYLPREITPRYHIYQ